MSKANYTRGGWHRNIKPASKYPVIFAGRNTHVAQVITRGLGDDEAEANADLIAAAPALYEALEALRNGATPETLEKADIALLRAVGIYKQPDHEREAAA